MRWLWLALGYLFRSEAHGMKDDTSSKTSLNALCDYFFHLVTTSRHDVEFPRGLFQGRCLVLPIYM